MVPKRVDSTNQKRLPGNAHAHRGVFQARLSWQDMAKLKLKFRKISSDTHPLQLIKLHHFKLERFKSIY